MDQQCDTLKIVFSAAEYGGIVAKHITSFMIRFPDEVSFKAYNTNLKNYSAYTSYNRNVYKLYTLSGECIATMHIFTDANSYDINLSDAIPIDNKNKTFRFTRPYIPNKWKNYVKSLKEELIQNGYTYTPCGDIYDIICDTAENRGEVYWYGDECTKFAMIISNTAGKSEILETLKTKGLMFDRSDDYPRGYFRFSRPGESVKICFINPNIYFNPEILKIDHSDKTVALEEVNLSNIVVDPYYVAYLIRQFLNLNYTYKFDEKSEHITEFNRDILKLENVTKSNDDLLKSNNIPSEKEHITKPNQDLSKSANVTHAKISTSINKINKKLHLTEDNEIPVFKIVYKPNGDVQFTTNGNLVITTKWNKDYINFNIVFVDK